MQIVASHFILRYFRKIDLFTIDLGNNLTGPIETSQNHDTKFKIKIKDQFIKKYQNINNTYIQKYGNIGKLAFYEDVKFKQLEYCIYDNERIFEIEATYDDLNDEPSDYLTKILIAIEEEKNINKEKNDMIKDTIYTNVPDDITTPDMNLPKEQYLDALIKYKNLSEKINNSNE